jgi:thiosulfate/3-mercaptopyruvate sulfurtransferase
MSRADVLVDADWAEAHLEDPAIVFVEVDEDVSAYDGGHIAGAVRLDWTKELQQPEVRDLIDQDDFSKLMSEKGIGNDHTVVLYGGNNNWFAAYAYWQFKLYGHENVKLLDGGRKKWELDGRELVKDVPVREKTSYAAKEPDLSIRAFRDEVIASIGSKNLVDVRSPDEFSGKIKAPAHLPQEQSQRAGHVPTGHQHPVEQGGLPTTAPSARRGARQALQRAGLRRRDADHRLLPHRRALFAHLVRAARAARQGRRQELRRAPGPSTAPWWASRSRRTSDVRRA